MGQSTDQKIVTRFAFQSGIMTGSSFSLCGSVVYPPCAYIMMFAPTLRIRRHDVATR